MVQSTNDTSYAPLIQYLLLLHRATSLPQLATSLPHRDDLGCFGLLGSFCALCDDLGIVPKNEWALVGVWWALGGLCYGYGTTMVRVCYGCWILARP